MPTLPAVISRRLLTVLQLTRMALVFTAIADSQRAAKRNEKRVITGPG